MVLNTCLSFLNEVMASEPFFEERSDAVKMSETPYPTNGSGKNLAKDTGIKCDFLYLLPDSSLSLITLWFRSAHSHTPTAQEWRQECFWFFYNDSDPCTHPCPFRLAGSALPSVFGGSWQLRKKEIVVFIILYTLLPISYAGFFAPIHTLFIYFSSLRMLATAQEWRQEWIKSSRNSK